MADFTHFITFYFLMLCVRLAVFDHTLNICILYYY